MCASVPMSDGVNETDTTKKDGITSQLMRREFIEYVSQLTMIRTKRIFRLCYNKMSVELGEMD